MAELRHPSDVAAEHERAAYAANIVAITKARATPHPSQAIAAALGTQPHTINRVALAEFRAGHTKKAVVVQDKAAEAAEQTS